MKKNYSILIIIFIFINIPKVESSIFLRSESYAKYRNIEKFLVLASVDENGLLKSPIETIKKFQDSFTPSAHEKASLLKIRLGDILGTLTISDKGKNDDNKLLFSSPGLTIYFYSQTRIFSPHFSSPSIVDCPLPYALSMGSTESDLHIIVDDENEFYKFNKLAINIYEARNTFIPRDIIISFKKSKFNPLTPEEMDKINSSCFRSFRINMPYNTDIKDFGVYKIPFMYGTNKYQGEIWTSALFVAEKYITALKDQPKDKLRK